MNLSLDMREAQMSNNLLTEGQELSRYIEEVLSQEDSLSVQNGLLGHLWEDVWVYRGLGGSQQIEMSGYEISESQDLQRRWKGVQFIFCLECQYVYGQPQMCLELHRTKKSSLESRGSFLLQLMGFDSYAKQTVHSSTNINESGLHLLSEHP